jgi:hypothetical protein
MAAKSETNLLHGTHASLHPSLRRVPLLFFSLYENLNGDTDGSSLRKANSTHYTIQRLIKRNGGSTTYLAVCTALPTRSHKTPSVLTFTRFDPRPHKMTAETSCRCRNAAASSVATGHWRLLFALLVRTVDVDASCMCERDKKRRCWCWCWIKEEGKQGHRIRR